MACVYRVDGEPFDVGAPAAFMSDYFAAEFVAMDGFVENGNPDPGAARVTGVVLGGAGGPRV